MGNEHSAPSPIEESEDSWPTSEVATPAPVDPSPKVWINYYSFPDIIRNVIHHAGIEEVKAFRLTSRACCAMVDATLRQHLILDGGCPNLLWGPIVVAVLHNGVWGLVGNRGCNQFWTAVGSTGAGAPDVVHTSSLLPLLAARVLDCRGMVRGPVVRAFAGRMPNLHTLRMYYRIAGCDDSRTDPLWTVPLLELGDDRGMTAEEWNVRSTTLPMPASVQRVVAFTCLQPPMSASFPTAYPPNTRELVVCIAYSADTAYTFREPDVECTPTPSSLARLTVIFRPGNGPRKYYQDCAVSRHGTYSSLPELLALSDVPTTIVGLEAVAATPTFASLGYANLAAPLKVAAANVEFRALTEYRASIGEALWDLYTSEAEVDHRFLRRAVGESVEGDFLLGESMRGSSL